MRVSAGETVRVEPAGLPARLAADWPVRSNPGSSPRPPVFQRHGIRAPALRGASSDGQPVTLAIDRGTNHVRQIGLAIRLVEQRYAGVEAAVMHDGILGIAGRKQHLERWPALRCLLGEL